jgi:DDE superfamily endonuclease/winged helix-turn-helix protein
MARELIGREFDVRLSEVSVGRLLRKLGLSPQRPWTAPISRTRRRWRAGRKAETYPQLRTEAARVGATIYFADEAGCAATPTPGPPGRWWAAPGSGDHGRPVRDQPDLGGDRQGQVGFAAYEGSLNGPVFIDFCRRLLPDTPGPMFLVLDGHPVHRSKAVKQFAASTGDRLRLCFLPGYAPELNRTSECGARQAGPARPRRRDQPRRPQSQALAALHRAAKLPHMVPSCFRDPNLRYLLTFALGRKAVTARGCAEQHDSAPRRRAAWLSSGRGIAGRHAEPTPRGPGWDACHERAARGGSLASSQPTAFQLPYFSRSK